MNILSRFDFMQNKINESKANDELINKIDYTLLKPDASEADIIELCRKASILNVKSVCVLPKMVKIAGAALNESGVLVCTVISFPHGTDSSDNKLGECRRAIIDGADEIDMVLNYPILKHVEEDFDTIVNELVEEVYKLVDECHKRSNKNNDPVTLKVIVESGLLSLEQTQLATKICIEAGADFIKTSTGMVEVGAELDKVQIMRQTIEFYNSPLKIKASGGLRSVEDLKKFNPFVDRFGVGFTAVDKIFGEDLGTIDDY
jgi:deoxyribose-phosphate aldolase